MSVLTNWGYTLTGVDSFTDLLTTEEFNTFTANKYSGDVRIAGGISAASSAIRTYVGWHLYPSADCELTVLMNDRRVTRVGPDLLVQLPAAYVSAVSAVTVNSTTYTTFSFETNGTLRIYDVSFTGLHRYSPIVVTYTAGLPAAMMGGLKELASNMITHGIASSNGITSEAAGGVSVTYNAGWVNSARATALTDDTKGTLEPFRLQGVF